MRKSHDTKMPAICIEIQKWQAKNGFTNQEAANTIGMHLRTYEYIKRGQAPGPASLEKIRRAMMK